MKQLSRIFGFLFSLLVLVACNAETEMFEPTVDADGYITCKMNFQGSIDEYGAATRGSEYQWADGDRLYIKFYKGTKVVNGFAIYSSTTSDWSVSYAGSLTTNAWDKCEVYFFTNATRVSNTEVALDVTSGIYEAFDATYSLSNGELTLIASLQPKCGRIRLVSSARDTIMLGGIKHYSKFDLNSDTCYSIASDKLYLPFKYSDNKYSSEYLYVDSLSTPYSLELIHLSDAMTLYEKEISSEAFAAKNSGVITIPTQNLNKGWSVRKNDWNDDRFCELLANQQYLTAPADTAVDMGLSVDWSSKYMNNTYYWGRTSSVSSSTNTVTSNISGTSYDVATYLWGSKWQIPTMEQYYELLNNTVCVYGTKGTTWGYYYVSKINLNVIFIESGKKFWLGDPYSSSSAYCICSGNYVDWWSKSNYYYILPVRVK